MEMKSIFYVSIFSVFCSCLNAQDFSAHLIGNINGNYIIRETRTHRLRESNSLLRLDTSLNIPAKSVPVSGMLKNEVLSKIMQLGDRIVLFTQQTDNRNDRQILYSRYIDPVTLLAEDQRKILTESALSEDKSGMGGKYTFSLSAEGNKLLVVREEVSNILRARPKTIDISVFDRDLNLLWHKKETLTYSDKQFKPIIYRVEGTGDVVITGRARFDKDTVDTRLLRNYALLEITGNGQKSTLRNFPMEVADYKISGDLVSFLNDNILAAGFYKIPGAGRRYGYFLQEYDRQTLMREKNYYHPLARISVEPEDSQPGSGKHGKNDADDMYVFTINSVKTDSSGNYILVGEQNKTVIYTNQGRTSITEYYLDIFILKLDQEGNMLWEARIPKKQVFSPTKNKKAGNLYDFASYALVNTGNNLMFFINDNPANPLNTNRAKTVRWKKSLSQVFIIDKNGEILRKTISDVPGYMMNNSFFTVLPGNRALTRFSGYRKYDRADYRILDLTRILAK
jgi:hypothetical protein